jgi:hypothetical protein
MNLRNLPDETSCGGLVLQTGCQVPQDIKKQLERVHQCKRITARQSYYQMIGLAAEGWFFKPGARCLIYTKYKETVRACTPM